MPGLLVPPPAPALNAFADADWWARPLPDGLAVEHGPRGAHLRGPLPWDGERTLLVVPPAATWLLTTPVAERLAALEGWRLQVLEVLEVAAGSGGPVHLAGHDGVPADAHELVALAAGHRGPATDLAAAATLEPDVDVDPVPPPAGPDAAPLAAFARALVDGLRPGTRASGLTRTLAVWDAAGVLARGTTGADPGEHPGAALALREQVREVLGALAEAGVVLTGRRDVLLPPVPTVGGRIAIDLAAEAAADVLRGQVERPTVHDADLVAVNDLERIVQPLRAERAARLARRASVTDLPPRALLRGLLGRNR